MLKLTKSDALIIVDMQLDFCPGGALPVPEGDKIIPNLNRYIELFEAKNLPIILTRDWHPKDHVSFKEQGGLWAKHCIKNTEGAKFHPDLKLPPKVVVISKATKKNQEAYSGFKNTSLKKILKKRKIKRLFIGGLATEYCVKETILDALKYDFTTFLLEDASKGVNLKESDVEKAKEEMLRQGAVTITLKDLKTC